jgi:predicted amidophosphoribosyltransferase
MRLGLWEFIAILVLLALCTFVIVAVFTLTRRWLNKNNKTQNPVCPKCGKKATIGAAYCQACGASLNAINKTEAKIN